MDKRTAVLAGALTVFARDGYSRASIDTIAAEAGVSTRTIYNHFACKADLFQTVIVASAGQVAEAQLAVIDRYLTTITDLKKDLVEFGIAWRTPMPDHATHAALVRQVNADAGHIPPKAVEAWQAAGPLTVRRALAARFEQFAAAGVLRRTDPLRAALHFSLLISGANPSYRHETPAPEEIEEAVVAGVDTFLHGHGA